ncbi:MAG: glycoside hydrolase family 16 protein [Eudoraea sp.]|nr:glycoside hydrolase family 16 protein [Eudoraea sp.]
MKKVIKRYGSFLLIFLVFMACQEDEPGLTTLLVPTNLSIATDIASDQSGNVSVTVTADNALNIHVIFKENNEPVVVRPGEPATFQYTQSGQYSQIITVVAYGVGGTASSESISIDLDVRLLIDPSILQKLAGDGTKRWVWNKEETGHWGADAAFNEQNDGFQAPPNSINPCAYDDVLVFSYDANDTYSYQLETGANDETLVGWADVQYFFPNATPQQFVDECHDISTSNSTAVRTIDTDTSFLVVEEDGEFYLEVENSTLSFWSGATRYKIIELTDDFLSVRGDHQPILESIEIAYYHQFRPEDYDPDAAFESEFNTLFWSEEFDVAGAPDPAIWNYDLGDLGVNNEEQIYTNDPSNIIVEDDLLKITAIADGLGGYTSARIQTLDNFEFQYGRVEIRAKLPTGGGTWPALWMLGGDLLTNPWPAAGEIDIMEHVGNNQDVILGSTHDPNNFAGNSRSVTTTLPGASDDFHLYGIEWTAGEITFLIDNEPYGTLENNGSLPFNKDFFFILNVAMGGDLGGTIDPAFTQSTMEVDYIRVYQ